MICAIRLRRIHGQGGHASATAGCFRARRVRVCECSTRWCTLRYIRRVGGPIVGLDVWYHINFNQNNSPESVSNTVFRANINTLKPIYIQQQSQIQCPASTLSSAPAPSRLRSRRAAAPRAFAAMRTPPSDATATTRVSPLSCITAATATSGFSSLSWRRQRASSEDHKSIAQWSRMR